ncbi:hypothetical protein N9C10_04440 [Flavobacteriaceae bacterium]|nr:hypothetical protein [Flavobacteriaceae bacterium]
MNDKLVCALTICGSFIHAFLASFLVMSSRQRFIRNSMHIPYGYVGGIISKHNINYGFIYFTLIVVYQILEEIGNLIMYKHDVSWYDIEGYTIGFSYHVLFSFLKNRHDNSNKFSSVNLVESSL